MHSVSSCPLSAQMVVDEFKDILKEFGTSMAINVRTEKDGGFNIT